MKKSKMKFLASSICAILCTSSLTLQVFAENNLNSKYAVVQEKEGQQNLEEEEVRYTGVVPIELTESEIIQFTDVFVEACKEEFGIDVREAISEAAEFYSGGYKYLDSGIISISLNWKNETTSFDYGEVASAGFTTFNFVNGEVPPISSITLNNLVDVNEYEGFKNMAIEAYETGLNIPVVEDEYDINLYIHKSLTKEIFFGDEINDLVIIEMNYKGDDPERNRSYKIGFDKVNFEEEIERLYLFQNIPKENFEPNRISGRPNYVSIDDEQKQKMLETAQEFLNNIGIEVNEMEEAISTTFQGQYGIEFKFDYDGLKDPHREVVYITVTPDLEVLQCNIAYEMVFGGGGWDQ